MSGDAGDRDLEARFAALRQTDRRDVPPFAAPAARAHRPVGLVGAMPLLARAAALAAVVAGGAFAVNALVRPRGLPVEAEPSQFRVQWKPITDSLLQTPGREILRTVPRIGVPHVVLAPPMPSPQKRSRS